MVNASFNRKIYSQYQAPSFEEILQPLMVKQEMFDQSVATLDSMKQNLQTSFSRDEKALSEIQNNINGVISEASNSLLETGDIRGAKNSILSAKQYIGDNIENPNSEGYKILERQQRLQQAVTTSSELRKSKDYLASDIDTALQNAIAGYESGNLDDFKYSEPKRYVDKNERLLKFANTIKPQTIQQDTGWSYTADGNWTNNIITVSERPVEVSEYILNKLASSDIELQDYLKWSAEQQVAMMKYTDSWIYSDEEDIKNIQLLIQDRLRIQNDKKLTKKQKNQLTESYDNRIKELVEYVAVPEEEKENIYAERFKNDFYEQQILQPISAISEGIREYDYREKKNIKTMSAFQLEYYGLKKPKFPELNLEDAGFANLNISDDTINTLTEVKKTPDFKLIDKNNQIVSPDTFKKELLQHIENSGKSLDEFINNNFINRHLFNKGLSEEEAFNQFSSVLFETVISNAISVEFMYFLPYSNNQILQTFLKQGGFKREKLSDSEKEHIIKIKKDELFRKMEIHNATLPEDSKPFTDVKSFAAYYKKALENTKNIPVLTDSENVSDVNILSAIKNKTKGAASILQDRKFSYKTHDGKWVTPKKFDNIPDLLKDVVFTSAAKIVEHPNPDYAGGHELRGVDNDGQSFIFYVEPTFERDKASSLLAKFGSMIRQTGEVYHEPVEMVNGEYKVKTNDELFNSTPTVSNFYLDNTFINVNTKFVPIPQIVSNASGQQVVDIKNTYIMLQDPESGEWEIMTEINTATKSRSPLKIPYQEAVRSVYGSNLIK